MNNDTVNRVAKKILDAKYLILESYPFFGRILMRVPILLRENTPEQEEFTASTDMNRIFFGIGFAEKINTEQVTFVLLHEIMHCVLKHCIRGKNLIHYPYNIACDIVVNSLLLELMGIEEMEIDGHNAMHLTPDNREGRLFTAEEVYNMLLSNSEQDNGQTTDMHDMWEDVSESGLYSEKWDVFIKDAIIKTNGDLPLGLKRPIEKAESSKIDWRQVLHDFIQFTNYDFVFAPTDHRFQDSIIMPSFSVDSEGAAIEKTWFCVDASASVSKAALSEVMGEIKNAIEQIDSVSGAISFFDTDITAPHPFDSLESLEQAEPIGGGGTSFHCIFKRMSEFFGEELPKCVIIMTDGFAPFPDEESCCGIPVLWVLTRNVVKPPFGTVIYLDN